MTDIKKIIEDLEYARYHCTSSKGKDAINNALDLINRQQAEIERLQSMNQSKLDTIHDLSAEIEDARNGVKSFKGKYESAVKTAKELQTVIKEKDAEIEGLFETLDYRLEKILELEDKLKTAKAEAIKEFAERLEEKAFHDMNDGEAIVCCCDIDDLVKEMVGK